MEKAQDPRLRIYGVFLFLCHVLTWNFWSGDSGLFQSVITDPLPLCWSFFPGCETYRLLPFDGWSLVLGFYFALSLLGVLFFLSSKVSVHAFLLLALVTLGKFFLLMADYRLMGNYHYMPFLITMAFLFIPRPQNFILYLLVGFYMGAGILKFNLEWLTGAALFLPSPVGGDLMELLLALVVVFEITGVLLLLSQKLLWAVLLLAVCFAFHAFSWHIVGYYYPLNMFALLTAFPLFRTLGPISGLRWVPHLPLKKFEWSLLAVFALAQVLPHVLDSRMELTGRGRMLSLNMLDARAQCENFAFLHRPESDGSWTTIEASSDRKDLGIRIACDPLIFIAEAQRICTDRQTATLSTALYSRRTTDLEFLKVLDWSDACTSQRGLNWWGDFD